MAANLDDLIAQAAARNGIAPDVARRYVKIESGGDPNARTGSYKGALQLSDSEFRKYGGTGSIYDPEQNLNAGLAKIAAESKPFIAKYGREPSAGELYLIHQQGWGGFQAHMDNPDRPAWESMASTAEGRKKGEGWSKQAISGNMPASWGASPNLTSGEFIKRWSDKVEGGKQPEPAAAGPLPPPAQLAQAPESPASAPIAPEAPAAAPPTLSAITEAMRSAGGAFQRPAQPYAPEQQIPMAPNPQNRMAVLASRPVGTIRA